MNYGYYGFIMLICVAEMHAMSNSVGSTLKRQNSKGIPIPQQSPTSMRAALQEDTVSRTQDCLLLKSAFAAFIEDVEKNRQLLAGLSKELETTHEDPKREALLSLSRDILNDLQNEIRASKLLIAQNSGGCPPAPPSSPADD